MTAVFTDIFLMEAYVNEKMPNLNADSLTIIKRAFYKDILKHHKADSAAFYTTFNYYQSHPKEFSELLALVDSNMLNINPLDTTLVKTEASTPKNIEKLSNFNVQEQAMQKEFLKNSPALQKLELKKSQNNK